MKRKVLAGLLSFAMVFSLMPSTAVFAEEDVNNTSQIETQADGQEEAPTETQTDNQEATQQEETKTSDSVTSLQNRIASLPSVEEFQSAEKSKQDEIYKETQAISDEYDKLSEEEQGQVDTSKLEALFTYFNSLTEETATTITPSSVGSNSYYISSGGTYTLSGGTYYSSYNSIVINTTAAVTLNIDEDITATASSSAFINVDKACSNLTINGNGHTINQTGGSNALTTCSGSVTYLNNVTIIGLANTKPVIANSGTMYLQSGNYSATGSVGQVFSNANGTLYIQGTTKITNVKGTNDAVAGGNVYMTGGTVSAPNGGAIRSNQSGKTVKITGGTISGSKYGVYVKENNPNCTIGNVTFSGNTNDVYLGSGQKFTLSTDYKGVDKIKVGVADTISANTQRQITTTGTAQSMLAKVTSVNSAYTVNYDTSSKYLYLWKHAHTWSYSVNGNTITAKCTSDSKCGYFSTGVTSTLTAPNATYSGKAYNGASIENNITSVTGATAGSIKYAGRAGTTYAESTTAPTNAGKYTASVTIGGKTATANFEITKKQIDKPAADGTHYVYNGNNQFYKIPASGWYSVNGNSRTDAGTQTVTVKLLDKTNSEWSDGTTDDLTFDFNISKLQVTKPTANTKSFTYNKQEQEYELVNSDYYEITNNKRTNAGYQMVKVALKDTANTEWKDGTQDALSFKFEIGKANPEVNVTMATDLVYNGSEQALVTAGTTFGGTLKYQLNGGDWTTEIPTAKDAGTYTVKYKVFGDDNYNTVTGTLTVVIDKKDVKVSGLTANGKTYDGNTNATVNCNNAVFDGIIGNDKLTVTANGTFDSKDVGERTVTLDTLTLGGADSKNYKLTDSDNQTTTTATITPKDITATITTKNGVYGGTVAEATAVLNGLVGEENPEITLTYTGKANDGTDYNSTDIPALAGKYTVTATIADGNYSLAKSEETFEIAKMQVTKPAENTKSFVYNTQEQEYELVNSDYYEIINNKRTNAGYQMVKVALKDTANTEWKDGTQDALSFKFEIGKANPEVNVTMATDLVYNGSEQALVTAGTTSGGTLKYQLNGGDWTTEIPTAKDAGTYTVKYKVFGDDNYNDGIETIKEVTIKKADLKVTESTYSGTYDGKSHEVNVSAAPSATITYKTSTESDYTSEAPSFKDAGTYSVDYKVVKDNYNTVKGTLVVVIDKKDVKVSGLTANGKTYDGTTDATVNCDNAVFDGIIGNDKLTVTANGTFDSKDAGERTVTFDTLTLGGADLKNYKLADSGNQTTTTATIAPKNITATITANGGVYGGAITGATAVLNGLVGEENPEITLTYTGTANDGTVVNGTKAPTHAGTYTVTASIVDSNYSLSKDGASAEYVVAKATPGLSVSAVADKNYGDKAFKLEVSHKGDGVESYMSSNEKVAKVDKDGKVSIIGAGKATLTVSLAETANYTADQKEVSVTVKKIDRELVVKNLTYNVTYGDPAFKIAAEAGDYETAIKFTSKNPDVASVSEDGTVTVGNAGTAKITVSMDESDDYLAAAKEVTVNVAPKAVTVTANDASKVYGEKDDKFTYKADGLVGKDALSDITLTRTEGEDVGTYDITASEKKNANPNYSVTFHKGTFTITQKEIGLTWTDTELTYNGKDQKPTATATGLIGKDTCEVTVSGAQKDAGTYTATAVKVSNKNYKLPKEAETTAQIIAKDITAAITPNGGTYEGTITPATAVLNGLVKGDDPEITLTYTGTANDGTVVNGTKVPTHAGTYTVTASIADRNYNLLKDSASAEYVVAKAASQLSVSAVSDKNYGDEAFKLEVSHKGDGVESYTSSNEKVAKVDKDGEVTIVGAGKATLTVSLAENANYTADQKEVTVKVAPKAVTVTANDAEKHISKADPNLNATVSGVVGTDQLKGITVSREAGEAAGTYAINVTVDADANPNYDITTVSGTFTINDHDWSGEWKTVKEATATEDGKREKTCAYDGCEEKLYETIPATGIPEEPENPGEGTLEKDAEVAPDAPISEATLDNEKSELIKADGIFTEAEKEAISSGSNARVWLEITGVDMDTISKDDQAAMEAAAKEIMGENLKLTYFNADLFKQVEGTAKSQIHEPGIMIKVTIQIPEELLNHDKNIAREYKILRLHDGKVDVINGTFNAETNEFTFETDRFSTYAIAYGDTCISEKPTDTKPTDTKPADNNMTNKPDAKKDTTSAKAPKTDDPTNAAPWAVVALMAGCVAVITGKTRKKERR